MARGVRDMDIGHPRLNEERNEAIVAMRVSLDATIKEKIGGLSGEMLEIIDENNITLCEMLGV
jgi:hypothetical protein